jgi:hypothetical protein
MAVGLPRVCRQLYAETATLIYSENDFAFYTDKAMEQWLSKRLEAQREVVTRVFLILFGPSKKNELMKRTRSMCPNIKDLSRAGWLWGRIMSV